MVPTAGDAIGQYWQKTQPLQGLIVAEMPRFRGNDTSL
jgi:hypothetical protein